MAAFTIYGGTKLFEACTKKKGARSNAILMGDDDVEDTATLHYASNSK